MYPWRHDAYSVNELLRLNRLVDEAFAELRLDCCAPEDVSRYKRLTAERREYEIGLIAQTEQKIAARKVEFQSPYGAVISVGRLRNP